MKTHVQTVVKHFKGKVHGWDVVNEAILDDGRMRESYYYKIIGPEFIRMAFEFAHEADPDVELYYNDYSMDKPAKRDAVVQLVRDLKEQGVRIDGVGMQSHVAFDTPLDEYEKSIKAFAAEGVQVMVTELDLSVLPWPKGNFGAAVETNFDYQEEMNPYTEGLPEEKAAEQTKFFSDLFQIYLRNSDAITRVTFWGVSDGDSWKNDWPVKGRTDYPLAFDRNYDPKPFVGEIIELATEAAE
jgi:endo-1,4-beta-xylanase